MKFYLLTYSLTKFILQIIRIKTQRKSKTLIILILLRTSKNITFYKIFHGCPLKLDTLLMNCSQSILPVTLSFQICSPKNFMTLCLCSSFDLNLLFVFFTFVWSLDGDRALLLFSFVLIFSSQFGDTGCKGVTLSEFIGISSLISEFLSARYSSFSTPTSVFSIRSFFVIYMSSSLIFSPRLNFTSSAARSNLPILLSCNISSGRR